MIRNEDVQRNILFAIFLRENMYDYMQRGKDGSCMSAITFTYTYSVARNRAIFMKLKTRIYCL